MVRNDYYATPEKPQAIDEADRSGAPGRVADVKCFSRASVEVRAKSGPLNDKGNIRVCPTLPSRMGMPRQDP